MELKNFIWKFVSKDKSKPAVCGIYMDPEEKTAVATDGCIMLTSKSFYSPDMSGKIIFKNGDVWNTIACEGNDNTCRYPSYLSCFPKAYEERTNLSIAKNFNLRLRCASQIAELKAFKNCLISVRLNPLRSIWVDYTYGKLMKQFGLNGWFSGDKNWKVLSKDTSDGTMLVMPVNLEEMPGAFIPELMECGICVPCENITLNEQAEAIQIATDSGVFNGKLDT